MPLIETAAGMAAAHEICAVDDVARAPFGTIDFANDLGVDPDDREALQFYRSMLVLASAAAGLASPIDGVTTTFDRTDTVTADFKYSRRLGLTGKLCIHPTQVAAVHAAAAPSDGDIRWATAIVDAVDSCGTNGGSAAVEGRMVDAPVVERARRILAERARS